MILDFSIYSYRDIPILLFQLDKFEIRFVAELSPFLKTLISIQIELSGPPTSFIVTYIGDPRFDP